MTNWFDVSKKGLARQSKERGAPRIFLELVSNALDERDSGVTKINITVEPIAGRPLAHVIVEDNSPVGFRDLKHGHTLFAHSYKRNNPELRGQFDLGEKLWLSLCKTAMIETTTGTTVFDEDGRTDYPRRKREVGTIVEGVMEITREEVSELDELVYQLLLPTGVAVSYQGDVLEVREPIKTFETTLPTQMPDEEGVMRPRQRKTVVRVYEVREGEQPHLYEMGVPVVPLLDLRWHVSIGQKVPLNKDRDNVRPTYLKKLYTPVAEAMRKKLTAEDASKWGSVVREDKNASDKVIDTLLTKQFGKKRASFDPGDREANARVPLEGGTIITGRMLSKAEWENVRSRGLVKPSSKVAPVARPFSDDPNASPVEYIDESDWSDDMRNISEYSQWVVTEILGIVLVVRFAKNLNQTRGRQPDAGFGRGNLQATLWFNMHKLGRRWFRRSNMLSINKLLIHEFGHQVTDAHHLTDDFHDACCEIGSKLAELASTQTEEYQRFTKNP